MTRPFSFRYLSNVAAVLEPWRAKLGQDNMHGGDNDFNGVVTLLAGRDRAIEDHLSLGVAQGYLDTASTTNQQAGLITSYTDLTDLAVTVTVPANRRLIITAHARLKNDNVAAANIVGLLAIYEGGTNVSERATGLLTAGATPGDSEDLDFCAFVTPTAGEHTYKLRAAMSSNDGRMVAYAQNEAYVTAEDIGPATRS